MDEIEVTPASGEDWHAFIARAGQLDGTTERVVLELHQRLLAVEARLPRVGPAACVAPRVEAATTADGLSPVEPAPKAPQGVTVEELSGIMREMPDTGYRGEAAWLITHPRIGPLLRGEGAPVQSPVVLPEEPPALLWLLTQDYRYMQGRRDAWAEARAMLARQQGGQAPLEGLVPLAYDAGDGVQILRITSEDGDWSVRNSRHVSPIAGFSTAAAAWAALQQARQQGGQADG